MASAFQSGAFQSGAFQIESIPVPTTGGSGGGGNHPRIRSMSPEERQRYRQFLRRKAEREALSEEEQARLLEQAWRRAHGIPEPVEAEAAALAAEIAAELAIQPPALPDPEQTRRVTEMVAMLAELRAQAAAEMQQQLALDQDMDDAAAVLLLLAA